VRDLGEFGVPAAAHLLEHGVGPLELLEVEHGPRAPAHDDHRVAELLACGQIAVVESVRVDLAVVEELDLQGLGVEEDADRGLLLAEVETVMLHHEGGGEVLLEVV
jgi:hypothetical protein